MRREHVGNEVAIALRYPACQLVLRQLLALALELGRDNEINAVGLSADMLVDPRQLLVQPLRRERRRAKYSEPACVGDLSHHVPAVAEGEEREIDTKLL